MPRSSRRKRRSESDDDDSWNGSDDDRPARKSKIRKTMTSDATRTKTSLRHSTRISRHADRSMKDDENNSSSSPSAMTSPSNGGSAKEPMQWGRDMYKQDDKKVPLCIRELYGQIGFVKWTNTYCPVLIINPCQAVQQDNLPSGIYHAWMDKFENALTKKQHSSSATSTVSRKVSNPELPVLIYWYGTSYEYSVVVPKHVIRYDDAIRKGYDVIPDFVKHRRDKGLPLPYAYELCFLATPRLSSDLDKLPRDRRVVLPAISSNTTDTTTSRQQRRKNKLSAVDTATVSESVVLNEWHTLSLDGLGAELANTGSGVHTKQPFTVQRKNVLRCIHPMVKATFGKIYFSYYAKQATGSNRSKKKAGTRGSNNSSKSQSPLHPVLILSPFRCPPGPIRTEWFTRYKKWTSAAVRSTDNIPCLVYWYGAFTCDQSSVRPFSFVTLSRIISYQEGVDQGLDKLPPDMLARYNKNDEPKRGSKKIAGKKQLGRLSVLQDWLVCGFWELQNALKVKPADRWGGMEDFEEDYRDDFEYYVSCVGIEQYSDGEGSNDASTAQQEQDTPSDQNSQARCQRTDVECASPHARRVDRANGQINHAGRESMVVNRQGGKNESESAARSIIEIDEDDDDSAQTVIVLEDTTSCSSSSSSSSCLTPLNEANDWSDDETLTQEQDDAALLPETTASTTTWEETKRQPSSNKAVTLPQRGPRIPLPSMCASEALDCKQTDHDEEDDEKHQPDLKSEEDPLQEQQHEDFLGKSREPTTQAPSKGEPITALNATPTSHSVGTQGQGLCRIMDCNQSIITQQPSKLQSSFLPQSGALVFNAFQGKNMEKIESRIELQPSALGDRVMDQVCSFGKSSGDTPTRSATKTSACLGLSSTCVPNRDEESEKSANPSQLKSGSCSPSVKLANTNERLEDLRKRKQQKEEAFSQAIEHCLKERGQRAS